MSKENGKPAEVHSLRIPPPLVARVKAKVKKTGKTKTAVMLLAIERGLARVK